WYSRWPGCWRYCRCKAGWLSSPWPTYISCVSWRFLALDSADFVHSLAQRLVDGMHGALRGFVIPVIGDHVDHGGDGIRVGSFQESAFDARIRRNDGRVPLRIQVAEATVLS